LLDMRLLASDGMHGNARCVWSLQCTEHPFGRTDIISGREVEHRILNVLDWRERRYSEVLRCVGRAYPGRDMAVSFCRAVKRLHSRGRIGRAKKLTQRGEAYDVLWAVTRPVVLKPSC
jgi:hypothetical protein